MHSLKRFIKWTHLTSTFSKKFGNCNNGTAIAIICFILLYAFLGTLVITLSVLGTVPNLLHSLYWPVCSSLVIIALFFGIISST